jgi:hypothetical protein
MFALLASPVAACAAEAVASETQQMACCQHGHHDCGAAMKAADCCNQSSHRPLELGTAKTEQGPSNVMPVLLALYPQSLLSLGVDSVAKPIHRAALPVDTSPPDCIAFTVLLI